MKIEAWIAVAVLTCAVLVIVIRAVQLRRRSFATELQRDLALYRASLISERPPKFGERAPFPAISIQIHTLRDEVVDTYFVDRVVLIRLAIGREHQVWARLDFDKTRPRRGLDELQIQWSPPLTELS